MEHDYLRLEAFHMLGVVAVRIHLRDGSRGPADCGGVVGRTYWVEATPGASSHQQLADAASYGLELCARYTRRPPETGMPAGGPSAAGGSGCDTAHGGPPP